MEAVISLKKMNNYERQYKIIDLTSNNMFDIIENKRELLNNLFINADENYTMIFLNEKSSDIKDGKEINKLSISLFILEKCIMSI